jgi:hypothetical protein
MLYLIKIGSDKGSTFYELVTRAVSSEKPMHEIKKYFENTYQGLTVNVSAVELSPDTMADSAKPYLENIWVHYTDEEKTLHEKVIKLREDAYTAEYDLHKSINARYKILNYTNITSKNPMLIETDREGTTIKRLPLSGAAFLEKAGDGTDI